MARGRSVTASEPCSDINEVVVIGVDHEVAVRDSGERLEHACDPRRLIGERHGGGLVSLLV